MLPTSFRNALLICTVTLVLAGAAAAGDDSRRGDPYGRHDKEWKSESQDGPCLVKEERDGTDSLLEVKCKDGVGKRWRGIWKEEFRDGSCIVKVDAKHDEYKEEVKCDEHDD